MYGIPWRTRQLPSHKPECFVHSLAVNTQLVHIDRAAEAALDGRISLCENELVCHCSGIEKVQVFPQG